MLRFFFDAIASRSMQWILKYYLSYNAREIDLLRHNVKVGLIPLFLWIHIFCYFSFDSPPYSRGSFEHSRTDGEPAKFLFGLAVCRRVLIVTNTVGFERLPGHLWRSKLNTMRKYYWTLASRCRSPSRFVHRTFYASLWKALCSLRVKISLTKNIEYWTGSWGHFCHFDLSNEAVFHG